MLSFVTSRTLNQGLPQVLAERLKVLEAAHPQSEIWHHGIGRQKPSYVLRIA